MILPDKEFVAIAEGAADFTDYRSGRYFVKRDSEPASKGSALRLRDPALLPPWAIDLRRMLDALAKCDFSPRQGSPLAKLCEIGTRFGWLELESAISPQLLALVSTKAKRGLKRELRRILERTTRPCLDLERESYGLALAALGLQETTTDHQFVDRRFLGNKPSERLFPMFRRFPVLPRLWLELISQWRDQAAELLARLAADRAALSRAFFGGQPAGPVVALRCGLSDPHNKGRTVALVEFAAGAVIYKPRLGDGEWEWGSLLARMNSQLFQPKLRWGRVLRRKGYYWMERIDRAPCKNKAAARRYYQRLGGMIAAAYLLRAVDCHRDNIIASGEYPILIDTDALWHVSGKTGKNGVLARLLNTGFFPDTNPKSLRSRSSILGAWAGDNSFPCIGRGAIGRSYYNKEIRNGFCEGWHSILGTPGRRRHFLKRLKRICSRKRRWICRSTERYAAIREASIQGPALRSGIERDQLIARLSTGVEVNTHLVAKEIDALKRLDIPYFQRRGKGRITVEACDIEADIPKILERLLD